MWYKSYTGLRVHFDERKSRKLRKDPSRGIGFEETEELFRLPHGFDRRSDDPEQYRAIGWIRGRLYTVIYEAREDDDGQYFHLVTPWKATAEDRRLYEESV